MCTSGQTATLSTPSADKVGRKVVKPRKSRLKQTFLCTLVVNLIINNMAKISIISEKITPLGGIIQEGELFSRYMDSIGNKNDQLLKKNLRKSVLQLSALSWHES